MDKNKWDPVEWKALKDKLFLLSKNQLIALMEAVDIKFTVPKNDLTKKDIVLVLDEADKEKLECAYKEIEKNI